MATKTRTVAELHATYAARLAAVVGLTVAEYEPTTDGLAELLRDTAGRLSPVDPNQEWLEEAADHLNAVGLLGDSREASKVLRTVDNTLYEAVGELETC
jgi:hypothetical protein